MKKTLCVMALLLGAASSSHASETTLKGRSAAAIINALRITSQDGNDERSGVDFAEGASQEGLGTDNVIANWTTASGKIGSKSVECISQVYMKYKVSKKNIAAYQDTYECKVK